MKNDYQSPVSSLDINSFKDIPNRKYKDDENDLESFIDFLKHLFILDPINRWNAKMALKHPFITREKFQNKFILFKQDMSIMNTSIEASFISDFNRSYNSVCLDYNNNDFNQSCGSFQDQKFESKKVDYQSIPLNNLNAKILRNPVPQAMLVNFYNENYNNQQKLCKNKFDNPAGNKSFMMMASFDKSVNNSFTHDHRQTNNYYYTSNNKNQNKKKKKKKVTHKSKYDIASNTNYNNMPFTNYNSKKISSTSNLFRLSLFNRQTSWLLRKTWFLQRPERSSTLQK